MTPKITEIIEEFDEKVSELKNAELVGDESEIKEFGQRVMCSCGGLCWKIVDFGNIKSFLLQSLSSIRQEALKEVMNGLPKGKDHICRFNDGDCECSCYWKCLDEITKNIIKLRG